MMAYQVKEIYYTLQGEGAHAGRPAVFCRFAGCNLWSGREEDRESSVCSFCDTDFVGTDGPGGGEFDSPEALASAVSSAWPKGVPSSVRPFVVCTGGEPLLQLDQPLLDALHRARFAVAVETNGTILAPDGIDWLTVSPKPGAKWAQCGGNELKLVFPQEELQPHEPEHLTFDHYYLQPMDGPNRDENTALAADYCLKNPRWKLSLQIHKLIGMP